MARSGPLVAFGDLARRHAAWIAMGLVRPVDRGWRTRRSCSNTDGNPAAITDKAFLWHFDSRWFRPGAPGEVSTLPWGAAGMFVCADARMTEIPRRLAGSGARLLDPTALVLSPLGKDAQLEYMLSARAWENRAFLAVANKCGSEAGIARYGGRSAIFDPSGDRLNEAGIDDPAVVAADVYLPDAPGLRVRAAPETEHELTVPTDSLPIAEALARPPPAVSFRAAMVRERVDHRRMAAELGSMWRSDGTYRRREALCRSTAVGSASATRRIGLATKKEMAPGTHIVRDRPVATG